MALSGGIDLILTKETPHNDAPQIGGYRQLENR